MMSGFRNFTGSWYQKEQSGLPCRRHLHTPLGEIIGKFCSEPVLLKIKHT